MQNFSNKILGFWNEGAQGWAPPETTNKLLSARLDWLIDLTNALSIWTDKNSNLSNGELILAYANLGALVEGWLKLFYCVHYANYIDEPKHSKSGDVIEPNDLKFELLKQFSRDKLWKLNDEWDLWVTKIQHRRNAIHSFNTKDIGNSIEFLQDIGEYSHFIKLINNRMPQQEDCDYSL